MCYQIDIVRLRLVDYSKEVYYPDIWLFFSLNRKYKDLINLMVVSDKHVIFSYNFELPDLCALPSSLPYG